MFDVLNAPSFVIGKPVMLTALFSTLTGVPTSPSTVSLSLQLQGSGQPAIVVTGSQLSNPSAGSFSYVFQPPASGVWNWYWQGTGALVSADQGQFIVVPSLIQPS